MPAARRFIGDGRTAFGAEMPLDRLAGIAGLAVAWSACLQPTAPASARRRPRQNALPVNFWQSGNGRHRRTRARHSRCSGPCRKDSRRRSEAWSDLPLLCVGARCHARRRQRNTSDSAFSTLSAGREMLYDAACTTVRSPFDCQFIQRVGLPMTEPTAFTIVEAEPEDASTVPASTSLLDNKRCLTFGVRIRMTRPGSILPEWWRTGRRHGGRALSRPSSHYMLIGGDQLDDLYVSPAWQGRGFGRHCSTWRNAEPRSPHPLDISAQPKGADHL